MSSPPPDYNPAASVLQGGTSAQILPVMGGGGMAPSADYNAGESVLAVGGTVATIEAVSGGGYTMEGGKDGEGEDPEEEDDDDDSDSASASDSPKEEVVPIQIEVYDPFDAPGIEENRKDYIVKLSEELNRDGSAWKTEFDKLNESYKEEYKKIRKDLADEQPLYETIPSTVKTIICIKHNVEAVDGTAVATATNVLAKAKAARVDIGKAKIYLNSSRTAAKTKAFADEANANTTLIIAKNPNVVNFLKTFQFLYTQGFFQNTSQSDLRLKKGVCIILYGLFTGDKEQDKILLYLFLKMKQSNKDMVYLLKTKGPAAEADLLGPSYVIYEPPIGGYEGIMFTEEEIDDKVRYNNYYKVSSGGSGPIEGPADWKAWGAAMTLPITALWIDKKKTQITLSKPGLEPVLLQKGDCIQFKNTSDKTYDGIIAAFRFSEVDGPPISIFLHTWHNDTEKYGNQGEIKFTQIINKIKCNTGGNYNDIYKIIMGSQDGGGTTDHPLCTTLKGFESSLDKLQLPPENPSYITILRPRVKDRNPLICPDTLDSPFISKAFHSGEDNPTYIDGDKKVKLLIDGKAYLIRIATEEALGAKGQVKANWEKSIFSEGEADLLNDLQLTPPLLSTVFKDKWNKELATFLDHISNPEYSCYSNVSIIPSRLCDHTRDFINRILREKYKEELHKKISKNIQPGVWPEKFTQIDKEQYKKGMDVVIVSASSGQAGFFHYDEDEKGKRDIELKTLQEKYKKDYVILF